MSKLYSGRNCLPCSATKRMARQMKSTSSSVWRKWKFTRAQPGFSPMFPRMIDLRRSLGLPSVDMEDPVSVRGGAGAPGPALDPEQVVEQAGHKARVQPGSAHADVEGEDRKPVLGSDIPHRARLPGARKAVVGAVDEFLSRAEIRDWTELLLQLHGQRCPQGLEDARGCPASP